MSFPRMAKTSASLSVRPSRHPQSSTKSPPSPPPTCSPSPALLGSIVGAGVSEKMPTGAGVSRDEKRNGEEVGLSVAKMSGWMSAQTA